MVDNIMMDAIKYVHENKLHKEANTLANKVGDIYMACLMLYHNIPQTEKNLKMCKRIVKQRIETDKKAFYDLLNEKVYLSTKIADILYDNQNNLY